MFFFSTPNARSITIGNSNQPPSVSELVTLLCSVFFGGLSLTLTVAFIMACSKKSEKVGMTFLSRVFGFFSSSSFFFSGLCRYGSRSFFSFWRSSHNCDCSGCSHCCGNRQPWNVSILQKLFVVVSSCLINHAASMVFKCPLLPLPLEQPQLLSTVEWACFSRRLRDT